MSTRWAALTLKKLLKALADVADWRTLGINLDVNFSTLNKIERDYSKCNDRMSQMLYTWLSGNTGATWKHIVTALREMNLNNIAKNIEAEYRYSTHEQKSQIEQSYVSPPTSTTPLVPATPPPLVTSPRARGTPTLPESASLITDSEGPPTSQVDVTEAITQIVPPPLVTSPGARGTPTLPESASLITDSEGPPTSVVGIPEAVTQSIHPPLANSQIQATSAPLVNLSQISPPPTTESMFISTDTEDSEEDRLQVVEEEIGELDRKFRNLVLNAGEYLTKKESIPGFLSKFRINLVHPPAPQVQQHTQFFDQKRKDLINASSVEEVFLILGSYWNWWNYSLLQHVIDSFGSQELKDQLHCYLKDLEEFEKNTIVEDFICACHSYLGVPPEFTEVRTRMKGDWTKHTVYQIRKLGRKLARKIARSSPLETRAETPFVGMSHSSIVLIWAVPSTAVHVLAAAIDEEFLQSNEIESVTINGKDLSSYQSQDGQPETPSKPVDPQDLHTAGKEGNVELTLDLLDAGVDIETRNPCRYERTPLMTACRYGSLEIVRLLLCFNANVNARDKNGWTPLMYACANGQVDIVHFLVEAHADLNAHNENGWTPLMYACHNGHVDIIHVLVEAHADLNAHNDDGYTPLMWACYHGHVDVVHVLVEAHADLNTHTKLGLTPLSLASGNGHTKIVRALVMAGVEVDAQPEFLGRTALMKASQRGHSSIVRELLDGGAGVNIQDNYGKTALFHACWDGKTEVVRELLQRQADVNIPTEEGLTPLIAATRKRYGEVVELLLSSGKVDTEIQEQETGWTALLIAANDGNINLVRLLLQYEANPGAVDKQGLTALDIAQEGGHTAVCEELHKYVHPQTTTDPEPFSPDSEDPKSQPTPISSGSEDHKSQPTPISPDSEDPKSQQKGPRSGREHRSSSRDSNRSKTTTQRWVQEARRRLKALFKRLEDQLLPSKTEKSRIITGFEDPSHQEHSVKKKGVAPLHEVAETTSVP